MSKAKFLLEEKEDGHMSIEVIGKPQVLAAMIASAMEDDPQLAFTIKMAVVGAIAAEERREQEQGQKEDDVLMEMVTKMFEHRKDNSKLN